MIMPGNAAGAAPGGTHGFPSALTSFVGRKAETDKVVALLDEYRLVTVTGPGGVGKTRLATEGAGQAAGRVADRAGAGNGQRPGPGCGSDGPGNPASHGSAGDGAGYRCASAPAGAAGPRQLRACPRRGRGALRSPADDRG